MSQWPLGNYERYAVGNNAAEYLAALIEEMASEHERGG